MHQHLHDTPPQILRYVRDCPRALESLIQKLMQKDPADRPPDAIAVARRLEDIWQAAALGEETVDADAVKESPRPRAPAIGKSLTAAGKGVPGWLVGVGLAVMAAMLVWNLALLGRTLAPSRAEQRWFEAMKSADAPVRVAAAEALGEIASDRARAAQHLMQGLSDASPDVRLASVASLERLGVDGRPALATLRGLQNTDTSAQVREQAAMSIEVIGKAKSRSPWPLYLALALVLVGLCVVGYVAAKQQVARRR
jgi:hypothetical protein